MSHKFEVSHKHKLDNPDRRKMLPPCETLQKLSLVFGDIMADVGCGIGYFTLPAAQIVGAQGTVYAIDISQEMLLAVEQKAREASLSNIRIIKAQENNFQVASGAITYGFASFVLHEADDLLSFLQEFKRILHESGKAVFIEWEKKETTMGPPIHHRLAKEELEKVLAVLGFINIRQLKLDDAIYAIVADNH